MGKSVILAVMLAAFTFPALAEDAATKNKDAASATKANVATSASKDKAEKPIYVEGGYSGCAKRHSSAANMM